MDIKARVVSGSGADSKRNNFVEGYYKGTLNVIPYEKHDIRVHKERFDLFDSFTCVYGSIDGEICIVCVSKFGFNRDRSGMFIIAKEKLRDKFNLVDGDEVTIRY